MLNSLPDANARSLKIKVEHDRLDAASAKDLRNLLVGHLGEGVDQLEIDLGQVRVLDSSGAGALVTLFRHFQGQGRITLRNARGQVLTLLLALQLDRVFQIVSD